MGKSVFHALYLAPLFLSVASMPIHSENVPASEVTTSARLLVANQGDRTLSIIDPVAGKVIAAVPVGGITGHEAATSPDGRTAYVPIYGNSGVAKPGTDGTSMAVIDIPSQKVTATVDFGHAVRPHCPIYDPVSKMLYVTTELDKSISIIDPKTLKIVGSIPTGEAYSHMFTISHDGQRGYTSNVEPGSVSVLDMKARKVLTVIPISPFSQRIAVSRDDKMVFTSDQTKPQLAVIDTATNAVKTWVPLAAPGYGTGATLDGRWLLVTMPKASQVAVVDLNTLKVVKTIDVPSAPQEVLLRPDGKVAYISCNVKNQIAVINLSDWTVEKLIDAGKTSDGLAWAK
jgi:YVTN family beta-propeller protein